MVRARHGHNNNAQDDAEFDHDRKSGYSWSFGGGVGDTSWSRLSAGTDDASGIADPVRVERASDAAGG